MDKILIAKELCNIARKIASIKRKWKRDNKETGRMSMGYDNELRGWSLMEGSEVVAFISNSSFRQTSFSGDDLGLWQVWLMAHGSNIQMKKKFDKNQVEEAKKFAEEVYDIILENKDGKYNDMNERIVKLRKSRNLPDFK